MRTSFSFFIKFYQITILIFVCQISNGQWSQFRGVIRDGYCPETNLLKEWPEYGPKLVWYSDTIGTGFSSASINEGIVYTTGKKDSVEILSAFDINGILLWQKEFGRAVNCDWPESRSTPTIYKNNVYAISLAGDIACFNKNNGELIWQFKVVDYFGGITNYPGFTESLLIADDKVIVSPCGNQTTLSALDYLTGKIIWTSESISDTSRHTSPVLIEANGVKLIVTTTNNYILAFNLNDGKITWKENEFMGIVPLPLGKQFYLNGNGNKGGIMYCVNSENNFSVLWDDSTHSNYMGGSVISGNKIYFTRDNRNRGLICIDAISGKILSINKEVNSGNLLATEDMLYCYEERNGRVCLLKITDSGAELVNSFIIRKGGSGPHLAHLSIANGYLYVRHGNVLMAYDIRS